MRDLWAFLKSKALLLNILAVGLVTILVVVAVLQWLKTSTHHGEFIEVPNLAKLSVIEMRDVIEKADLRYEVLDSANFNPEYPRFSIIEQNPPAGNKVKRHRKIYVTVNPSGYKKVTVPKIIQVTRRNATSMLRAVGLDVERVTYIDQLGKDMVYYVKYKGKRINEGDKVPKTSKIELICGNGIIPSQAQIKAESQ